MIFHLGLLLFSASLLETALAEHAHEHISMGNCTWRYSPNDIEGGCLDDELPRGFCAGGCGVTEEPPHLANLTGVKLKLAVLLKRDELHLFIL